jgi:hypothetical protein
MHWSYRASVTLASWALMGGLVSAQPAPPASEDCLACHGEPSNARADGRPIFVEPDTFAQSIHSFLACVDCHTDLAALIDYPHADRLAPVDCAICHDAASALATSVHASIPADRGGPATCGDCHGPPHRIRPSAEPDSPTSHLNVAMTCAQCHGDAADPARRGPTVASMFADSIHGQALTRTGLVVAPTCTNCHDSHAIVTRQDPASPVFATNVAATCGSCHAGIHLEYSESVHAAELQNGASAPHCATCHTAHEIAAPESDQWQLSAVEECGTCHREALATYRDTFHGQVTALGFTPVARCADCHTSHRVLRVTDARSPVSAGNRLVTCQTCHPSATPNFALYEPHANKDDPDRLPVLYYAARLMNGLLIAVFGFFGLHTTLWFLRERTGPAADPDDEAKDA